MLRKIGTHKEDKLLFMHHPKVDRISFQKKKVGRITEASWHQLKIFICFKLFYNINSGRERFF